MAGKGSGNVRQKTLTSASSLANLLPTGTVLAFEALMPSFSYDGSCQITNKYLTAILISFCAITCFLSSFTDSFYSPTDEKIYYGIATFHGLKIFNLNKEERNELDKDLSMYHITFIDFVHALLSVFVFLVFALSNSDVQSCFFSNAGDNQKALIMNMPLGAGVLSGFLFSIFPTRRRGIGFADMSPADQAQRSCSPPTNKDSLVQEQKSSQFEGP